MQRPFSTFIGIDLGGARGKTTAVARLSLRGEESGVTVEEVSTRRAGIEPWNDSALLDYLSELDNESSVLAVNAPLTVPACLRCQLTVCPGKDECVDPAVVWLRNEGAQIAAQAVENDLDRIAVIPTVHTTASGRRVTGPPPPQPRIEPYMHRGVEVKLHYERGLLPRDSLGIGTGPIAARAAHLRRMLAGMNFDLHRNLLEVSPRATVHALFGAHKARGYKRDADPWETRAAIVESLTDVRFALCSRMSREDVLRNDHCFDALLSAYTSYRWARDGWTMPRGIFAEDGWIWAPPRDR
ncbi:MAG: DUF429 domain-containing protein [Proteobacteria bacterium]|nr:DUF429 domain-containing protein [Pseudomonadota bacterium]